MAEEKETDKEKKNGNDSPDTLRAGLHQAVRAFAVLSGVGIYLVVSSASVCSLEISQIHTFLAAAMRAN